MKTKYLILFIFVCALGALSFLFLKNEKNNADNMAITQDFKRVLKQTVQAPDTLDNITASAVIDNNLRSTYYSENEGSPILFSKEISKNLSEYSLNYRIEYDNLDVTDVHINISNNKIYSFIENAGHNTKMTLNEGDKTIINSLPLDWSGKIELTSHLSNNDNICLFIENESKTTALCHSLVTERQGA